MYIDHDWHDNRSYNCDPVCERGLPNIQVWLLISRSFKCYYLVITHTVSPMLGYSQGLLNMCNWKGYKTQFLQTGSHLLYSLDEWQATKTC